MLTAVVAFVNKVACPRCLVASGIHCTSLGNTGYRKISKPHPERIDVAIRDLRDTEQAWITEHPGSATTNYAEYTQHTYAFRQAQVALGERRARRGSSKADAIRRCADLLAARAITDQQIRDLQTALFARNRGDELELHGLVACHEALGSGNHRTEQRARCAAIIETLRKEST